MTIKVVPTPTLQISVQTKYFCFQHFGSKSEKLKAELQTLLTKFFPTLNIKLIFTNKFSKKKGFFSKEILKMLAAAICVFNFLINLRLNQINLLTSVYCIDLVISGK